MGVDSKLFCLGLPKTGLPSISAAFEQLGYRVCGSPNRIYGRNIEEIKEGFWRRAERIVPRYDIFVDVPWCSVYSELAREYPNARFILTERDPDAWLESFDRHLLGSESALHRWTFGEVIKSRDGQELKRFYETHVTSVCAFFERDGCHKFARLNIYEGDGWAQIGELLDVDPPKTEFPRENPATKRKKVTWCLRRRPRAVVGKVIRRALGSL